MNLSSAYDPSKYEADIYSLWEKGRAFIANPASDKLHFSIAMPPPNETGTLHVGHALFLTLQDILARHARQTDHDVLWLPGTDHAALATNAIIEKKLAEQGTNKHAIGREEFIKQTKEFVGDSRNTINAQVKAMGASVDWSRARYTLDDALNRCVNETFVKMYNDGLIYRGHRIVNWDPNLETTVSDDEVVHKEEKGAFYTLQYGPFQIGTARPETKFGDKYVVMHPDDERYKQYKHGDTFEADWLNGKVTATVIKDAAVDPQFGTGVMTITPWHDHTDFEIAERHGLEKEQIIDFNGKLLPVAGEFAGMTIAEARPKIVAKLEDKGLLVNTDENYVHNLALNDRGKGVIEPQIKLQWFIDVNRPAVEWKGQLRSLKEVMRAVVEDGDIKIVPARFEKVYYAWIDNLRDWCISRQIWWGHQVPVWYKGDGEKPEVFAGVQAPKDDSWQQDPDTLDTWFSSALWTWSTLVDQDLAKDYSLSLNELLEKSADFKAYHPTSVMETGWDILFFWVARMVLTTTYMTGQVPFKTVYLHGLVRSEGGKKMSKSDPSSIIDPLDLIKTYGTDAVRLSLTAGAAAGNSQTLDTAKLVTNRNFCNKLWNIARYAESAQASGEVQPKSPADHWILNKLSISAKAINKALEDFKFNEAYDILYHFVWDDFADWFIEASKVQPNPGVLAQVLDSTLVLAHPFAPFITEAIWQSRSKSGLLASQTLPKTAKADADQVEVFEAIKDLVADVRRVQAVLSTRQSALAIESDQKELIEKLAGVKVAATSGQSGVKVGRAELEGWLNVDKSAYKSKLGEQKTAVVAAIQRLQDRLDNKAYVTGAPADLVEQTKQELAAAKAELEDIDNQLKF